MRIGIVTHAYYPQFGGVTENVAGSARALRALGHAVTVITAGTPAAGRDDHPDVVRIGGQCLVPWNGARVSLTYGWRLAERLAAVMRERAFDVVHVHCPLAPMLPLAAVRAADRRGLPVVGTFHATARWNPGYALFERALHRDWQRLTCRLAVSEPARRFVARYFPGSYRLLPNGVDLDRFSPAVPPAAVATPGEATVLCVGRLDPRKGVHHLIDAMPIVARVRRRVRLMIVGDGPCRPALVRRAARRAPGLVDFRGAVAPSELPGFYTAAHVVCSPATHNESFGIVLLEAMAAARPLVASDISGYRLVVEDGVCGRLVPPGRPDRLAAALIEILSAPDRATRMGMAGRGRARGFSWEELGRRLAALYGTIVGSPAAADGELAPCLAASS